MKQSATELLELIRGLSLKERSFLLAELETDLSPTVENEEVAGNNCMNITVTKEIEEILCPHCDSYNFIIHANYNGRKRYKCKDCNRTFNNLTGTSMSGTHLPEKWDAFLQCMLDGVSIIKISKQLKISHNTAFIWRHKILRCLDEIAVTSLAGIVESDETFFLYSEKGNKKLSGNRSPRKRGGTASKRGISNEQVPVIVACDRDKNLLMKVAGRGRISKDDIENVLGPYVSKGDTLCADAHGSYKSFAKKHGMKYKSLNANKKVRVIEKKYHIQNVNNMHSRFKLWMGGFKGVATKYLPNYATWFRMLELIKEDPNTMVAFKRYVLSSRKFLKAADVLV